MTMESHGYAAARDPWIPAGSPATLRKSVMRTLDATDTRWLKPWGQGWCTRPLSEYRLMRTRTRPIRKGRTRQPRHRDSNESGPVDVLPKATLGVWAAMGGPCLGRPSAVHAAQQPLPVQWKERAARALFWRV